MKFSRVSICLIEPVNRGEYPAADVLYWHLPFTSAQGQTPSHGRDILPSYGAHEML